MATTAAAPSPSSSPWGKPGGWAQDLEKQEQEEQQQQQQQQQQASLPDFPSLSAAAVTKTKKKKPQSVSLSEFTTGKTVSHGSYKPKGLTTDELSILPTGPRERSADEILLNGGFKSYSNPSDSTRRSNNNRYSNGDEDSSSRWGSSFNNNKDRDRDDRRGSKADESDDWGATKRSAPPPRDRDRASSRGNGSGFFDSQSKADESDSWLATKKKSEQPRRESNGVAAAADSSSSTWGNKRSAGEERPRLVLQPRSLPTNGDQPQPPSVTKTNPFGAARRREQVLAEKGQKIDEQLQSNVKIDVVVSSGRKSPTSPQDRTERSWRKTDPSTPSEEEDKPDKQGGDTELN